MNLIKKCFKQIKMLKRTQLLKNNYKESEYLQSISRCFLCLRVLVQIKMSKNKCLKKK